MNRIVQTPESKIEEMTAELLVRHLQRVYNSARIEREGSYYVVYCGSAPVSKADGYQKFRPVSTSPATGYVDVVNILNETPLCNKRMPGIKKLSDDICLQVQGKITQLMKV